MPENKRKAVFIGSEGSVNNVYSADVMEKLSSLFNFDTTHVIAKNEADKYRNELKNADYAFSTWGMPSFTKRKFKNIFPH